jgi:IrrE N-terminal-like domain
MTTVVHYKSPKVLLNELGITEPRDIHIEAIAQYCGATIVYEKLSGCEARIVGLGDQAIITVKKDSPRERQRFSAGHELGHWMRDRGRVAYQCEGKDFTGEWGEENPERRANRYATDILLPEFMFLPRAKNRPITFQTVQELSSEFSTSLTATAIRLVEYGSFPAMIACYSSNGRRWFIRGEDVPSFLWPVQRLERSTLAYSLLDSQNVIRTGPAELYADSWITHSDSHNYKIVEDSIKVSGDQVITLLWWQDERQLLDLTR